MWKMQFNRLYTEEEEIERRGVWESTVEFVNRHNMEADMGLHTYTVGLNQFSDWTDEEYKMLLGFNQPAGLNETLTVPTYMAPENMGPLPNDVDWRTKGYVTPVKNQASCGSCWAFSATGSLEGQQFRKSGQLRSLSEQQLVDCSRAFGNQGCNGGWMNNAFNYVASITKQSQFLDTESCYPYTAKDGTCHPNFAATCLGSTVTGFTNIPRGNEAGLASAITTAGPVSVAIDASRPGFRSYKSGIFSDPLCSSTRLDHGVLAVGFGDGYYIVKNSWAASWGNQGYINMAKDKNNMCGIATSASYPTV